VGAVMDGAIDDFITAFLKDQTAGNMSETI
jgi:hypothetical protein